MPKKKVIISAGATVIVEGRKYTCTGTNEVTGKTAAQVMKSIQDCIKKAAASSNPSRKKN